MENIKNLLKTIIEHTECSNPACKNCCSFKNGGCTFGCVNERVRLTSPNYACDNFDPLYKLNEDTLETIKDLLKDVERVEEGVKNLDLLLSGKIDEKDFNELVG